jgi:DNA repair protein RecN (Recombination protein N)
MLARLYIRNYAIISELDLELAQGLTIITGETGAGKSILLGALSLVLGKRADTTVLQDEADKCIVEAEFSIGHLELQRFFEENDLDNGPVAILRREITPQGKSRAFINDTPVKLQQLRDLASQLIDIHSQHEILTLKTDEFRCRFLDSCSDGSKSFSHYSEAYSTWNKLKKQVEKLRENQRQATAEEDYMRFQLGELESLNLKQGELDEIRIRLSTLENAEEIRISLARLSEALQGSESSLLDGLRNVEQELSRLARKFPVAGEWFQRVKAALIDLDDLSEDIDKQADSITEDPEELLRLQQRVDEILRLLTKHRKQTDAELMQLQTELEQRLQSLSNADEQLTLLNAELETAEAELAKAASALSRSRIDIAQQLSPKLTSALSVLGMPDAQISITVEATDRGFLGQDDIHFGFTSNKGQPLQDVAKVASGGELSRLMLVVKSEMARKAQLPTIIFDEIDTGVSGEVAGKMGEKIRELSTNMQVFCITHLPQIASKADDHLFVYKENTGDKTVTRIRKLDRNERIVEIAKMLSTANPTDAALMHATNLVNEK